MVSGRWFFTVLEECADFFNLPYTGVINRPDLQDILLDECKVPVPEESPHDFLLIWVIPVECQIKLHILYCMFYHVIMHASQSTCTVSVYHTYFTGVDSCTCETHENEWRVT